MDMTHIDVEKFEDRVSSTDVEVALGLISWLVYTISEFRIHMSPYWKDVSIMDALRYMDGEAREARDIWMRQQNPQHARNNQREWEYKHEIADVLIMGATALGAYGAENEWSPESSRVIAGFGYSPDDICAHSTESLENYRWRHLYAPVFEDAWVKTTEETMIAAIKAIGPEEVKGAVKEKCRYLVYKHVPDEDDKTMDVLKSVSWIFDADMDEVAF